MKTKNKALLLALCAVSLVTASVFGTMAYLTDNKTVTNTFTVGSVAITLDEAKVDTAGQPIDGAPRVQANEYKLLPGHEYTKDPTIHVDANSEDCYLFVKVENGIEAIEDESSKVADQMTRNGWAEVEGKGVYVYVGTETGATKPRAVTKENKNIPVFNNIKIAGSVDGTQLERYKNNNTTITVTAYAVQKDGFAGKSAAEIWTAAFPTV